MRIRRSRMSRSRTGKRLEITDRDIAIFSLLERHAFLRSSFLHAFVGGASETRLKERLCDLFHEGFIDRPAEQWSLANCRYTPAIYEAGQGGRRILADHGLFAGVRPVPSTAHRQFAHALMISDILASIELDLCHDPSLRLILWPEILAKAPHATQLLPHPLRIPLANNNLNGRAYLVPDAVFGIGFRRGGPELYRFFALEADRATMPVTRSDPLQSSFRSKLACYGEIVAHGTLRERLRLPNLLVLTVTTIQRHLEESMRALERSRDDPKPFLFRSTSDFPSYETKRLPMAGIARSVWHRAGKPPLSLVDFASC